MGSTAQTEGFDLTGEEPLLQRKSMGIGGVTFLSRKGGN